jgi:hypothetical protein
MNDFSFTVRIIMEENEDGVVSGRKGATALSAHIPSVLLITKKVHIVAVAADATHVSHTSYPF